MDQDEIEKKTEEPVNKISIIMFLLLFLVIIIIVLLVYVKSQNIDIKSFNVKDIFKNSFQILNQDIDANVTSEFQYDLKKNTFFYTYKDNIIKCTKESVIWLDRLGEEQKVKTISTENPVVKIAGAYILIADIGGKDFYIINGMNIKWSHKSDSSIINADISSNGYVSIVKEKKGYKGAIDIYDDIGNLVFTTVRGGAFVLSTKVISSKDRVLINKVDTADITANTILEFVNMRAEQVGEPAQEDNVILPSLWNLNGDYIIGVSDDVVICYNMNLKRKWKRDYTKIYSSNIALGKYSIIAIPSDTKSGLIGKSASEIKVINTKGEEVSTYTINDKVTNIECSGNIIAVNTGSEVYFINTNGKLIGKYISKSLIMGVHFFDRQEAMVQTQNSIVVLRI